MKATYTCEMNFDVVSTSDGFQFVPNHSMKNCAITIGDDEFEGMRRKQAEHEADSEHVLAPKVMVSQCAHCNGNHSIPFSSLIC